MILRGNCLELMPTLPADAFDAIVTDPPYHLTNRGGGPSGKGLEGPHARARAGASARGFMGKAWDGGDIAFRPETWAHALRVAKPGAFLAAFGATRTFHRLTCAIEDAGWEIRDTLMWVYGSGFPKSHNGDWGGTALKPAWEPIILARKSPAGTVAGNFEMHGTGGLRIDPCGIGGDVADGGRWPANLLHDGSDEVLGAFPYALGQQADASTDTSSRKTASVYGELRRGRGVEASAEAANDGGVGFKMRPGLRRLDSGSAARFFYCAKADNRDRHDGLEDPGHQFTTGALPHDFAAVNSGARGNHHPTVKPTALMRWLCRLVTPAGGHVLDPFTGSGSTGRGAIAEGLQFTGIELDPAYAAIAEARIRVTQPGLPLGDAA